MLAVIDIGNSNIVLGIFEGNFLVAKSRFETRLSQSADDYAIEIVESLLMAKINIAGIHSWAIASVVPNLISIIEHAIKKISNDCGVSKDSSDKQILIINQCRAKLPINIALKNKEEVGVDRLINAIAGYHYFGGDLIIIDFGTATTFDVVGSKGEYLGGVIAPGLNLSLKALYEATAQLPKIQPKAQKNVIGKNTFEAMNSGVYHGYLAMINGLCSKIDLELKANHMKNGNNIESDSSFVASRKIITGGVAEIFKSDLSVTESEQEFFSDSSCNKIIHCANLTLDGIRIVSNNLLSNKIANLQN